MGPSRTVRERDAQGRKGTRAPGATYPGDIMETTMARDSKIEWTHHTFNPWWGCQKVSPACKHCYAEAWSKRVGHAVWGVKAPRRFFGARHWSQPERWNQQAADEGVRRRVFCASMADVFEVRAELDPWRSRLWGLIENTPHLDWLLLTKRPEEVAGLIPWSKWPHNVWLGTTVEDPKWARLRLPHLLKVNPVVRFLSCEPLLAQVDLRPWLPQLDWVIVGGESGRKARPMSPAWAIDMRDQCTVAGVPFFFKQWGEWSIDKGTDMVRLGKKASGRWLDGRTWDQVPQPSVSRSSACCNSTSGSGGLRAFA